VCGPEHPYSEGQQNGRDRFSFSVDIDESLVERGGTDRRHEVAGEVAAVTRREQCQVVEAPSRNEDQP
jgi:hypothetical protein